MEGRLSLVPNTNLTIFEAGAIDSPNVLIFVGGLTDVIGSVGYLPKLSTTLKNENWGLLCLQLSSCYDQYGFRSLESDVRDIEEAVKYLRESRGKEKIVLLGHSTGCQDAIWYSTVDAAERPKLDGAILQAPASDSEYFEGSATPEALQWVKTAQQLVSEGKGADLLPLEASLSLLPPNDVEEKRAPAVGTSRGAPFTAYRFASLFGRRGDDDFFSSYLEETELKFSQSSVPLLVLLGEIDECYPPHLSSFDAKHALLTQWMSGSQGKISPLSTVIKGASHPIDDGNARELFYEVVGKFLRSL